MFILFLKQTFHFVKKKTTKNLSSTRCYPAKPRCVHQWRFGIVFFSLRRRYRFLELYYRRAETTHKSGRVVPSRVETVILFLPDVWRCVPTRLEWDSLHLNYKKQLERKLQRSASVPEADDLDNTADTDEATPTDQKALPISHPIFTLFSVFFSIFFLFNVKQFIYSISQI